MPERDANQPQPWHAALDAEGLEVMAMDSGDGSRASGQGERAIPGAELDANQLAADVRADPDVLAETLAQQFHETYERLAPQFGYVTRERSRVLWPDVPKDNRELMVAVVEEVVVPRIGALVARVTDLEAQVEDWKGKAEFSGMPAWERLWAQKEAAEAQVAALTQERDEALRVEAVMLEREPLRHEYLARAEAAEARAEALQQERDAERRWCKHWAERAEAAEAALAEADRVGTSAWAEKVLREREEAVMALALARAALEEIEDDPHDNVASIIARRALADTGGDTKEPA